MNDKCESCAALSAKLSLLESHAAAVSAELLDERARNMAASGIEQERTAAAEQRVRELLAEATEQRVRELLAEAKLYTVHGKITNVVLTAEVRCYCRAYTLVNESSAIVPGTCDARLHTIHGCKPPSATEQRVHELEAKLSVPIEDAVIDGIQGLGAKLSDLIR